MRTEKEIANRIAELNDELSETRGAWKTERLEAMIKRLRRELETGKAEFIHHMQPYGWVKIEGTLETRTVKQYVANRGFEGTREAKIVVGKIIESRYCGVYYGGVAVGVADNAKYPVGADYEVEVSAAQWNSGERVDVSM